MKKQLLLVFALLSFCISSAQLNPFDLVVCSETPVYLESVTPDVLGGLSPNDYTVTYHWSQADANTGENPIPSPIVASPGSILYFVRAVENANPSNVLTGTMNIVVQVTPSVSNQAFTVCDSDGVNDGFTTIDIGLAAEQVWAASGTNPSVLDLQFYETLSDATMAVNQINAQSGYMNIVAYNQTLFVRATSVMNGCSSVSSLNLIIADCDQLCAVPTQLTAYELTMTSAALSWTTTDGATQWQLMIVPTGAPAPTANDPGWIWTTTNPYIITGLACGNSYDAYVRSVCGQNIFSQYSAPITFTLPCIPQAGQPINLALCSDTNQACFNLTQNDSNFIGTLNPADYNVSYFLTQANADNDVAQIANPANYCVTQTGMESILIYARLENNANPSEFFVSSFALTVQQVEVANTSLPSMVQCDDNGDGIVTFDLTTVEAQLNTTFPITYYANSFDATNGNGTNAIANPATYSVSATMSQQYTVFIRVHVPATCDLIYSLPLSAFANCNLANMCASANPLCGTLGIPFANTVGMGSAELGINYDCLVTQPNPTWFFLPISQTGNLDFHISQVTAGGTGIDVDFICWGPFSSTSVCGPSFLNSTSQVACSYSAAPTEDFTIVNAQPGQYYLLMVTNFSNQAGYITISQSNAGIPNSGEIDCTGIRMTAFLDSNGNGTKDSGEPNFNLGQFNYEKNNDGNVHHISSPNGSYGIYDINAANSYDFGFDINPAYAANYALTTSSYSNVHVVPGAGTIDYYFPVTVTQAYNDLAVTIIPNEQPRPGFTYTNTLRYTNLGNQAVASGTVTFNKPSVVSITNISQGGTTPNASGFTYNFTNLLPFESREILITMLVPVIPNVAIGDLLTATATIEPLTGDVAPENNSCTSAQTIIGSYDPNDKMESHGPRIVITDFTSEDYLYYTVRFENTGTAAALNVRISDVLESKLDEASVLMVDASHDYTLDRVGNTLTWNFDDIQLPSTATDPEGGKGYVMFKVKPKPGYAIGDIIQNTASIYFDFNPAIVTNTFTTEFVPFLSNPSFNTGNFAMYPNPAGDHVTVTLSESAETIAGISVYDMLGKTILVRKPSAAGNSETIDVSGISTGMYFLEVTTANNMKSVKKLVIE